MGVEAFAGDVVRIGFVATTDDQADYTGAKVVASIAREPGKPAVIVKKNTAAGGSDAQLVVTSTTPGRIEGTILLTAAESAKLRDGYDVDVVAHTAAGDEVTFGVQQLTMKRRVSAAIA